MVDLAVVGAGPIGLETAIQAKRAGLDYIVLDKGCLVSAIYGYPTYMTFFTTSERLEIGGHPLVSATDKPTRKEALDYYRKVAHNEQLAVRTYASVSGLRSTKEGFELRVTPARGATELVRAKLVALATGYFDNPKMLGVEGEELPNVSHYYTEAHSYYGRPVVIVGGGSSAADAALDLYRGGAKVHIVHRGHDFRHSLKYWIRPNLENRIKEGSIAAHLSSVVRRIAPDHVSVLKEGREFDIPSDQTFVLTGYYASPALLEEVGASVNRHDLSAELDPETFESSVEGLFVLGSAGFGRRTSDVFIENGLVHVQAAMRAITARLSRKPALA